MFEVTTVNRLAARALLTKCGVRAEMGRTMSLRQIKEHLDNFVSLGNISADEVTRTLNGAQGNQPQNVGTPWTDQMDAELCDHFARGMSVSSMALIRGRTNVGINARLQRLGLQEWNQVTNRYELTAQGRLLQSREERMIDEEPIAVPPPPGNDATKPGQFADRGAIEAMDRALAQEKAAREGVQAPKAPGIIEPGKDASVANIMNALSARVGVVERNVAGHERAIGKLASDQATLQRTIADTIAAEVKRVQGAWQKFEIVTQDRTHRIEGLAHKAFPKLLRAVSARTRHDKGALNIWLYGPAGTGKSTAARKLAEAFGLAFHTNGPVGSQWDIRGFTDAQGKVVSTAFRRAWEGGGVYCWDEGDGSAPAALIEANGALATGFASFPDKTVERHKDCIVIINGNLRPGAAPDATYNGRYKQDTAFVNRFIAIEWGIDEDLELALLGKLDSIGEQWVKFVRKLRKKITERGIKGVVVSPRQLQYGVALLDAGAELDEVMEQTVKFMFTDDQWKQVQAA